MQFDWTTFVLEIINFLVLIWVLQRLLYRPIMNVIAQRHAMIEKTVAEAQAAAANAAALRQQYDERIAAWQKEKASAQTKLVEEIEAKRVQLIAALQVELAAEHEKHRTLEKQQEAVQQRQGEKDASAAAACFAARLLARLAEPALEAHICTLVREDLELLPNVQVLREALGKKGLLAHITSAFPLDENQREVIRAALNGLAGLPVSCRFEQDTDLIAGLLISVGPWLLRANIRDDLKFFAGDTHHATG